MACMFLVVFGVWWQWKLLHYMAKRFYAPIVVSVFQEEEESLQIWITNDKQNPIKVEVNLRIFTFSGEKVKESLFREIDLGLRFA